MVAELATRTHSHFHRYCVTWLAKVANDQKDTTKYESRMMTSTVTGRLLFGGLAQQEADRTPAASKKSRRKSRVYHYRRNQLAMTVVCND